MNLGITMASEDAIAAVSLPDPNNVNEQPGWLYRTQLFLGGSSVSDASQWGRVQEDLHAQRKYQGGATDLVLIMQRDAFVVDVRIVGIVRALIKRA